MTHAVRGLGLAATLVLISIVAAVPKARAASTSSTAAYVYIQIQGPEGAVYGFSASSSGKLRAIPGSPWKVAGEIIGGTPTKFFTLGQTLIHSYGVASNGALQSQIAQIPILDYSGSRCGGGKNGTDTAVLDHTGKYMYVLLQHGGDGLCAAYQSYKVNNDGSFAFDGDTEVMTAPGGVVDLPSILENEKFAYADEFYGQTSRLIGFRREPSGTLELMQFRETDPTLEGGSYIASRPDASPAGNYLALQLYRNDGSNPPQLGMYTVDPEGNISSTNTSENMQTSRWSSTSTMFAHSGDFFVTWAPTAGYMQGGLQTYKFNGAGPLYPYLTPWGISIDQVAWDGSNHLYALSKSENELQVVTLTSTSTSYGAGSMVSIRSPYKMVVVSE
jgi:hypothetical protein